jgi:thymidine kinase
MITFFYSVMGSGKSTLALQTHHTLKSKGFNPALVKSDVDTRDPGVIKSRIGLSQECESFESLNTSGITHLIVDEAQFLTEDEVEFLCDLSDNGIYILCFGLRTSFTGKLFEGSALLFAIADELIELPIISSDGNKCVLHVRRVDGKPVFDGDSIFVGDQDIYESVSRKEWRAIRKMFKIGDVIVKDEP